MTEDGIDPCYLEAARDALKQFPVAGKEVIPVSVSENLTFRVSAQYRDTDCVLRLHRPGYNSLEELDSERMWTRALREAGIAVPAAVRTHQGENYALIDIPGKGNGEQRYAGMTHWIEGTVLRDTLEAGLEPAERLDVFRGIGAMLAGLHNQSTSWRAPPGFTRRRLDVDGLLGETPAWGPFWEHPDLTGAERTALLKKRQELRVALRAYGESPERFSLIHADVDSGNIIHDGSELALIDFDDAAYGWHLYDMASSLDEFLLADDLEALESALIEGYCEHRPLAQRDIDMLPAFLQIRGMALIGWYLERPEHAGLCHFEEVKAWVLEKCV